MLLPTSFKEILKIKSKVNYRTRRSNVFDHFGTKINWLVTFNEHTPGL
jgi:hypothetical protein